MEWFGPIRGVLLHNLDALRWLVPALFAIAGVALLAWQLRASWVQGDLRLTPGSALSFGRSAGARAAWLVVVFGLAVWGQVFVGRQEWVSGGSLYAAAAVLLLVWLLGLRGDRGEDLPQQGALGRKTEILLVLLVVLVAAFARFYRLDKVPYGIEGDESKWSAKVAAEIFADQRRWDSDYVRKYVPYTFWTEAFFYRLMGISLKTARWQVAFQSLIASALFYLLARRLLGPPGALVAAFLLAVSIPDISASRLAHVESQIKLPLILSFLFLVYAVDTQRWYWYLLTGLATVLGLLAYDTYFMAPAVIGLWMGWRLLVDRRVRWLPSRGDWPGKIGRLVLFLVPVALVAQHSWFYISTRRGDHNKSVTSLMREGMRSAEQIWPQLRENLSQTLANFSYQRWGDFLMNRDGPIVNAVLVPLAALGLVYLIVRWRRGQNGLAPLWFLLLFFPAAVVFGSPWVRVFYPAFPAFYLLAAAALMLLVRTLHGLGQQGSRFQTGVRTGLVVALFLVGVNNLYVYLHEVKDFGERIARRQVTDLVAEHLAPGQMLYAPYMPRYDDFIEWEQEFMEFAAWGTAPIGEEDRYFRVLPYEELLPALSTEGSTLAGATVLYDRGAEPLQKERQAIIDTVTRCFPGIKIRRGERFDAVLIPQAGLQAPACLTAVAVFTEEPGNQVPADESAAPVGEAVHFAWRTEPPAVATTGRIEIAHKVPGVYWFEAEDLFNGPGWYVEGRFAPDFGGRGYLGDVWEAPDITAPVALPAAGRYTVWARTHRRVTADMPFTIALNGQPYEAARHLPEQFNQWLWERLGEVDVSTGSASVTLHRDYVGDRHMSVFLDALVFSQDPAFDPASGLWPVAFGSQVFPAQAGRFDLFPPGSESARLASLPGARPWRVQVIVGDRLVDAVLLMADPAVDIQQQDVWRVLSTPSSPAFAEASLAPGEYRWRVQVMNEDRIVSPTGEVGKWSDWTFFTIE